MLNERLAAAKKVAASLYKAEDEIDEAIASTSALIMSIMEARADAKLPAVMGQTALNELGAAVATLIEVRQAVAKAHEELDVTRDQLRLPVRAWGDQFPKPPPPSAAQEPHLTVVGS